MTAANSETLFKSALLFSLIDEVKEDLTFLANGITPVSIYDRYQNLLCQKACGLYHQ